MEDLKALESIWYQKLKDDGFDDIEDTTRSHRPLIEWHSFLFLSEETFARRLLDAEYQEKAEAFLNRPDWDEICSLIMRKRRIDYRIDHIRMIWKLHLKGMTERGIATYLKCSKTGVHKVIERFRAWMKLIE